MKMISKKNAWFFMILITFCWGGSYVCTKYVTDHIDPTLAFLLGGLLGAIIFFTLNFRKLAGFDRRQLRLIMKINLFSMLSNITSIIGIQYTTSTNAAFILQLSVVMVPLLMSIRLRTLPSRATVLGSGVALAGLALLTLDFNHLQVNPGDLLQIAAALFFSLYLVVLSDTKEHLRHQDILAVYYLMSLPVGLGLLIWRGQGIKLLFPLDDIVFLLIFGLSTIIVLTALTLQIGVSKHLPIELMSVSYCLEPVVTAFLAAMLLGEHLNTQNLIGIFVILLALIFMNWIAVLQRRRDSEANARSDPGQSSQCRENQQPSIDNE